MHSRADLRAYQERGAKFFCDNLNAAGFIDLGLGKTITSLTAFVDLQQAFEVRRALVVAPLRVARDVWQAEAAAWEHTKHLRVVKILGSPQQRKLALDTPADIHVINRENVPWLVDQFVQGKKQIRAWLWDLVLLDESQGFRAQSSQRWKALRRIRKLFPRLIELTATPTPNGLSGLWSQVYLLDGGQRLGSTETAFKQRWFDPPRFYEFGKWAPKPNAKREIEAALADIVLSMQTEDYLTLPPVMHNIIKVRLSTQAYDKYKRLERVSLIETMMGNKIKAVNAGVLAGKLLQLANGAVYVDDQGAYELLHDAKIDALLELLDDVDGPALIAYNFRSDLDRIGKALDKFCRASGKTWDVLKTEESVRRWNAGGTDYLLLHPASAGHGLNLQHSGSETIVWFGLTYDAELYDQLNARLTGGHRREGKNIVVHHLVAEGTIDEEVIQIVADKRHEQDALMRALSSRLGGSAEGMRPQPTRSADWQF